MILADHSTAASNDFTLNGYNLCPPPISSCTLACDQQGESALRLRKFKHDRTAGFQLCRDANNRQQLADHGLYERPSTYTGLRVGLKIGLEARRMNAIISTTPGLLWRSLTRSPTSIRRNRFQVAKSALTSPNGRVLLKTSTKRGSGPREWGATGGRLDLGPSPDWVVRWLYTGDYRTPNFA